MKLSDRDRIEVINRYTERYNNFGYSPITLGWNKGKQDLRFDVLSSLQDLTCKKILDVGCGFGDLNRVLKNKFEGYSYLGIDIVPDLINEANLRYSSETIHFMCSDFLAHEFNEPIDYIIASGIFNFKLNDMSNYLYIEKIIQKSLKLCNIGLAFDFLSDRVDYQYDHTFHSSPMKILEIAYKFSRNVVLRNDYMPFEFSLFIFKEDNFKQEDTVFFRKPYMGSQTP